MTDHNENKIDPKVRGEPTPDRRVMTSEATPTGGNSPAGDETLCPDSPGDNETTAVSSRIPIPNPFDDATGAAPLEDELRDLAARDSGVQLTETYQVCVGTPALLPLTAPAGSQEQEDQLACIGMAVRVTRIIEATGVPASEAPAIDMGHTPTQTITTHQEARGVIVGVLDNPPVDEPPQSSEPLERDDLYEINTDFTADLLRDGGGEALAQLVETYNPTLGSPLDFQHVPVIELDYNQLELDESGSGQEAESGLEEESSEPTVGARERLWADQSARDTDEAGTSEVWSEPISHQPGIQMRETEIEIQGMGLFRHGSGQPIQLRAYPYVRPKPASPSSKEPQAYREQDHYNPAWTYMRGTRRDRLQALVKAWREAVSPTENDQPTSAFEIQLYAGAEQILQEPPPWIGDIGPEADYNRLEKCNRLVMDAIRESGQLPRLEGGFNVVTPSYLTVVLPGDNAMLTAREVIELSVAFPYARGRRQLPLGERIIVNDLYGMPLYQPAERHLESDRSSGVLAAAAIIKATGADPPAPVGDVRPGAAANAPLGKRLVAPAASVPPDDESSSGSGSISQHGSVSSDSGPGPRQRVRRLTRRVISSDPEEVSDNTSEGVTSTAAPEFPALHVPSTASLTQAVTTSVFHRSQVETNGAATSGASPIIVRTSRARD